MVVCPPIWPCDKHLSRMSSAFAPRQALIESSTPQEAGQAVIENLNEIWRDYI